MARARANRGARALHRDRVKTADLLAHLHGVDDSPWSDWYGKPLSAHGLSRLLKPYRIKTLPVRVDGETVRGYKAEQFADAFARALGVTGVTGVTPQSASQNGSNARNASNAYPPDEPLDDWLDDLARTQEALEHERVESLP
jgi:hypothetical protein